MTDVTQMQMITFLCSFHEAFWMVWWMERDHAHGLYGSDGRENKLLMGNKRVLCLTLGYGFLWYGMREMLSCLPALLLLPSPSVFCGNAKRRSVFCMPQVICWDWR